MNLEYAHALHGFEPKLVTTSLTKPLQRLLNVKQDKFAQIIWNMVYLFVNDAENTKEEMYKGSPTLSSSSASSRTIPHIVLLQHLAQTRPFLRRAILACRWLELFFRYEAHEDSAFTKSLREKEKASMAQFLKNNNWLGYEKEEQLLYAVISHIRKGNLQGAARQCTEEGAAWRGAVFTCAQPSRVPGLSKWFPNASLIPLFGEYATDPTQELNSTVMDDAQRVRTLGTMKELKSRGAQNMRGSEETSAATQRLNRCVSGLLSGEIAATEGVFHFWYDRLWAILRCHLIHIQTQVSSKLHCEKSAAHKVGSWSDSGIESWLEKAEEGLVRDVHSCIENAKDENPRDQLMVKLLGGMLCNEKEWIHEALTVGITHQTAFDTIFLAHLFSVLHMSFMGHSFPFDISQHKGYSTLMQVASAAYCKEANKAREGDAERLFEAPLYLLCDIQSDTARDEHLVEYFIEAHTAGNNSMPSDRLEPLLAHMFSVFDCLTHTRYQNSSWDREEMLHAPVLAEKITKTVEYHIANESQVTELQLFTRSYFWVFLGCNLRNCEATLRVMLSRLREAIVRIGQLQEELNDARFILNGALGRPFFLLREKNANEDLVSCESEATEYETMMWYSYAESLATVAKDAELKLFYRNSDTTGISQSLSRRPIGEYFKLKRGFAWESSKTELDSTLMATLHYLDLWRSKSTLFVEETSSEIVAQLVEIHQSLVCKSMLYTTAGTKLSHCSEEHQNWVQNIVQKYPWTTKIRASNTYTETFLQKLEEILTNNAA